MAGDAEQFSLRNDREPAAWYAGPSNVTQGHTEQASGAPLQEQPALASTQTAELHLYPYGVDRQQLGQLIEQLNLPIVLTKDLEAAEAVLALQSNVNQHSNLVRLAREYQMPIHTVNANTIAQIQQALQQILGMASQPTLMEPELSLFAVRSTESDALDALEEALLAVEQVVLPKGQPVKLLPRSAEVRKMQHELVEHYRLKSSSLGEEPNRRLRIYPA